MRSYQETQEAIDRAMTQFPSVFGLRAFPGEIFRISKSHSYLNDSNVLMLYTEIKNKGEWQSFAKGTVSELLMNVVPLKMSVAENVKAVNEETLDAKVAREIRARIIEAVNGRGGYVFGMAPNTQWHRLMAVRTRKGIVQGRALNTGKWFTLAGFEVR